MQQNILRSLIILSVIPLFLNRLSAQCTTESGAINTAPLSVCEGEGLSLAMPSGTVLDADDILLFLAYTGATPQSGTILATSANGNFSYLPSFLAAGNFSVAAVAGNDNGSGMIDWTDPCVSVSPAAPVNYIAKPVISGADSYIITCNTTSITLDISVNQPATFLWTGAGITPANALLEKPQISVPGPYTVTVTSATTGCTATKTIVVLQDVVTPSVTIAHQIDCDGAIINVTPLPPAGIYIYEWTGPNGFVSSSQNVSVNLEGIYCLTITDVSTGCTNVTCYTVAFPPPMVLSFSPGDTLSLSCDSAGVVLTVAGGTPPYQYQWSHGVSTAFFVAKQSGVYTVTVTDAAGCTATTNINIVDDPDDCTYIRGNVYHDLNENCQRDPDEPGVPNTVLEALGVQSYYGFSNSAGNYFIFADTGSYILNVLPPSALWSPCVAQYNISLTGAPDSIILDIPLKALSPCPAMQVELTTNGLRRCFSNNYYIVKYCNNGTADAQGAYVDIKFDPFLEVLGATKTPVPLGNNLYRFELGDVPAGHCNLFSVNIKVSCDATLGQTHCTEAHIYPDSLCTSPSPQWSGASVQLRAECDGALDVVRFVIKNAGEGNMSGSLEYVIIEDGIMLMQALEPGLIAGDSMLVYQPANGSTWRLEAAQEPFHPGNSMPALSVEGCSDNGSFSIGYVNQFTQNDADEWIDIDCRENTGSFDPNDKQAFPAGYGPKHYILPETRLEYLIRFQNTGTDTAFKVVILDTLSEYLLISGIRPGPSSHPYQFDFPGEGIARFTFEPIALPDSNVNEAASHGFVRFSIAPKAGVPLETLIENKAAIYFDFNDPVITNTVFHTLGENFIVSAWNPVAEKYRITAWPNPAREEIYLHLEGIEDHQPLRLLLYGADGALKQHLTSPGNPIRLLRGDLPDGVYLFGIEKEGVLIGSGRIILQ